MRAKYVTHACLSASKLQVNRLNNVRDRINLNLHIFLYLSYIDPDQALQGQLLTLFLKKRACVNDPYGRTLVNM